MFPTVVTMGLAGIWHGAGLQFLAFGLLHGAYLTINHTLRMLRPRRPNGPPNGRVVHCGKVLTTYVAVPVASVFFRAPSAGSGLALLTGMVGLHGLDRIPVSHALLAILSGPGRQLSARGMAVAISPMDFLDNIRHVLWIVSLYFIVWGLPNTQQIMFRFIQSSNRDRPARVEHFVWQSSRGRAIAIGAVACASVPAIGGTTESLYFGF